MKRCIVALALLLLPTACGPGADAERRADQEYLAGRFPSAYARYRDAVAVSGEARLWAKAGAAAARDGQFSAAIEAYRRLSADPMRRAEAADGLADVASRARRAGDGSALRSALMALSQLAPGRPVGGLALALARDGAMDAGSATRFLPSALAVAPDGAVFDSLLLAYAGIMADRNACEEAAWAFGGVARRSREVATVDSARRGLARCALAEGQAAADPIRADRWLARAAAAGGESEVARQALLLLGRARMRQGDPIGAAIAWQRTIDLGSASDSLGVAAAEHLATLAALDTVPVIPGDTTLDSTRTIKE